MSSRGAARKRISWELVDDTDESDSDVYPKLEESYIHDLMLRAEINHALYEFRWNLLKVIVSHMLYMKVAFHVVVDG